MSFTVLTLTEENRRKFCCSDSTFDDAIAKLGEGSKVINPCYTDYGGEFIDYATIEHFKEKHPELIEWETTSWNGQNAIVKVDDDEMEGREYEPIYEIEDTFYRLENEMLDAETKAYCSEHDCNRLYDEVLEWLRDHANVIPNQVDYCGRDLDNFIIPEIVDTMNKEVKEAVILNEFDRQFAGEIRRLERMKWATGDMDSPKFKAIEGAIELLQEYTIC